ncbi:ABC transporter permease, partial [bacterium]|nr:ABC transporter permease [bacterium]
GLEAMRESIYYEKQSEGLMLFINVLGILITIFFSVGAMIGATITMYASVAHRQREFGTLRALGFSRLAVLGSCLFETFLMALAGGLVGCAGALCLQWVRFSMLNMTTWSEIVFTFEPVPRDMAVAMVASVVMGLLGGFLPAVRAARLSPVAAMRGE